VPADGRLSRPAAALAYATVLTAREVDVVPEGKRLAVSNARFLALVLAGAGAFLSGPATANDCAAQCYAQENACRRATQGSQSCDAELTRCLQACRAQR
jgi:hypothetical protein